MMKEDSALHAFALHLPKIAKMFGFCYWGGIVGGVGTGASFWICTWNGTGGLVNELKGFGGSGNKIDFDEFCCCNECFQEIIEVDDDTH